MSNTFENTLSSESINFPVVENPETGVVEELGNGKIAIMGQEGVARVVTLDQAESDDMIDRLVAGGDLTHSA